MKSSLMTGLCVALAPALRQLQSIAAEITKDDDRLLWVHEAELLVVPERSIDVVLMAPPLQKSSPRVGGASK